MAFLVLEQPTGGAWNRARRAGRELERRAIRHENHVRLVSALRTTGEPGGAGPARRSGGDSRYLPAPHAGAARPPAVTLVSGSAAAPRGESTGTGPVRVPPAGARRRQRGEGDAGAAAGRPAARRAAARAAGRARRAAPDRAPLASRRSLRPRVHGDPVRASLACGAFATLEHPANEDVALDLAGGRKR